MKELSLAYSKDMREDKKYVFDGALNLELSLTAMIGIVDDLQVNKDVMKQIADAGYTTATDFADWLVHELGLPFREAHHVAGP